MKSRVSRLQKGSVVATLALVLGASTAFSAEPTSHAAPSKEQREKMATIHEQMAACLRSDKPIADCHKEAMKSCQDMMGKEGCPMMHEHMMHQQQSPKTTEPK
jgi:hypothetical protein